MGGMDVFQLIQKSSTKGLTVPEIATVLGMPISTARWHVAGLEKAGKVVRPTPRGKVYAAGHSPRRHGSAPKPKPPAASPSRPRKPSRFDQAMQTLERHPEGVQGLVGLLVEAVGAGLGAGVHHSTRLRQWLDGKGARWPATEAFLRQMAEGQPPGVRERLEQQIRALRRLHAAASAKVHEVELRDMLGVLSDNQLRDLGHRAQQDDPPDLLAAQLAAGELKRRAELREAQAAADAQRRQHGAGLPAPIERPPLHVARPAPAGGLAITLGPDPFTGRRRRLDVMPAVPTQGEMLRRADGWHAGRYAGGEVRAVAFARYQQESAAAWRTKERARAQQQAEVAAARRRAEGEAAAWQVQDEAMRRRTKGAIGVGWGGRFRWTDEPPSRA